MDNLFSSQGTGSEFELDCMTSCVAICWRAVKKTFEECHPSGKAAGILKFDNEYKIISLMTILSNTPSGEKLKKDEMWKKRDKMFFGEWREIHNPDSNDPAARAEWVIQMSNKDDKSAIFFAHPFSKRLETELKKSTLENIYLKLKASVPQGGRDPWLEVNNSMLPDNTIIMEKLYNN